MKLLALAVALIFGVPVLITAAMKSRRLRSLILVGMMLAPVLGTKVSLNLVSMKDYRGPDRGYEICASDLAALALCVALALTPTRSTRWIPPGTFPLALLILSVAASAIGSPVPLLTSFALFKILRCSLLYWATVNALIREKSLQSLVLTWTALGLFLTMIAVYQKYRLGLYRIYGPFDHSNTIPLYVNLILPGLLVYLLSIGPQRLFFSCLQLTAVAGMTFAVLATFSRLGMALSAFAIALSLLWVNLRLRSRRSIVLTACLLTITILGGVRAAPSIITRFREAPDASAVARSEFNHVAYMMARDNSLGVGPNAFSYVMTVNPRYHENLVVLSDEESAGVAHQIYLLSAAELGYPGLCIFLFVLATFLFRAARAAFSSKSMESMVAGGLFIGCCCLHISGFYEWALRITPVTYQFTFVAAAIVAFECRIGDAAARIARSQNDQTVVNPASEIVPERPR